MAEVTVERLAAVVGVSVERLLKQLKDAGVGKKSQDEVINLEEKQKLLTYLKQVHTDTGNNTEQEKHADGKKLENKAKSPFKSKGKVIVNVEVRKKRPIVKAETPKAKDYKANKKRPTKHQGAKPEFKNTAGAKYDKSRGEKNTTDKNSRVVNKKPSSFAPASAPVTHADKFSNQPIPATDSRRAKKKNKHKDNKFESDGFKGKQGGKKSRYDGRDEWKSKRNKSSRASAPESVAMHGFTKPTAPVVRDIEIPETIIVAELANRMAVKAADVIKVLFKMGSMATINQVIDQETACIVVEEMGHKYKLVKADYLEDSLLENKDDDTYQKYPRSPVVTVMGHVDHGKTSLLDYIRKAKVQSGESGGITQHIGAYHVDTDHGGITFLDTPGHAAFTAMRARGAKVTDIVVLVVAADDGVMPQTEEAINHAKAAEVPIIVAVNKIDKPEADLERVKTELSGRNVVPDEWGGDSQFIPVSALTGEGIDNLLEGISNESELLELQASKEGLARGTVVESRIDKGRGVVTTALVQNGLLKMGDYVLAGHNSGRIRAIISDSGKPLETAGPSTPVEILGIDGVPNAGDELVVLNDERKIREIADMRQTRFREGKLAKQQATNLENLMHSMKSSAQKKKNLNIVLKTDVRGSLEALVDSLQKLGNEEVCVNVISSGVGGINETDANLALASNAVLVGFNVRADSLSRKVIEAEQLDLRYYSIIYDVLDDVEKALSGMLGSDAREEICGVAEVRQVFSGAKFGYIAGCIVLEGTVHRNKKIRVLRDDVVIFEGELESLKRFKDDVNEVKQGTECGIAVKSYNDVKEGDKIEVFQVVQVQRTLSS
jgi:translation initiation factor IF-2